MHRTLRFLLTAVTPLCVALPLTSVADEEELTWYAVEIIVFERTGEIGRDAEAWPFEPGLPGLAGAIELSPGGLTAEELAGDAPREASEETPAQTESTPTPVSPSIPLPRAFQLVPEEEYRLTDLWNRLDRASAFRPLLHTAWLQPGYPSEQARLVHVRNANAALGTVDIADDESVVEGGEAPPAGDDLGFGATLSPRISVARDPSKVALDGTLRIHRARYLHVEADLLYYRPLDGDAIAASGNDAGAAPMLDSPDTALIEQLLAEDDRAPRLFRLTQSRRMRSRELHYLDHPLFGMLVEIVPLELPEMPAEDDATQPAPDQSGG